MSHFSIGLWCVTTSGFYKTTSYNQLGWRRSSKALPKAKLVSIKNHGRCLEVCCRSDPLRLSESWRNHCIWEVCSATDETCWKLQCLQCHLSTERVQFLCMIMPNLTLHSQCFESWKNWAIKFCLIHHIHLTSHQPTTTSSSTSTIFFAGKMLPQAAGGRKCFPRVHRIPRHGFLWYRS